MALVLKTPGVYIQELDAFGNSVVPVPTAIPAFVGYTERASFGGKSLLNKPVRVESLPEFESFFGKGPANQFTLAEQADDATDAPDLHLSDKGYTLSAVAGTDFKLYDAIRFFYANGGGTCYVVAVGTYGNGKVAPDMSQEPFQTGMDLLKKEQEPTMLLVPDAMLLGADDADLPGKDCYALQGMMLNHCGEMMNRVAILDVFNGNKGLDDPNYNPVDNFRNQVTAISPKSYSYGATYYPWLNTALIQSTEVTYQNLDDASLTLLKGMLTDETNAGDFSDKQKQDRITHINMLGGGGGDAAAGGDDSAAGGDGASAAAAPVDASTLNGILSSMSPTYKTVMNAILEKRNVQPPGPAMAGVYTTVDNTRGVWKAPANVGVAQVVSPTVDIDHKQQEDLNVPLQGKAICAIRPFIGEGVLVWGARTLDGNSNDWRYINVRRTMIFLEESVKAAAKAYVFEPNDAGTWQAVKGMISNFLNGIWKQGGLAGAKPADAFSVSVGLGSTMTSQDILDGVMNVTVKVAVVRPAEFIVITFQQQMQKS